MPRSLASFPEELLARILALLFVTPARCVSGFPPPRHRTAPLLVSRQFFRIASPLFYQTLDFYAPHQTSRALATLARHVSLAHAVRRIVFGGIWHDCARVLALCAAVQDVDLCLDGGNADADPHDIDAEAFCCALEQRHGIMHLTIRKDPAVYLTHSRPSYVLQRLAQAVRSWSNLESVHFALRLSASPSTLPLARALSVAPRLCAIRAQLPAVWNNLLLLISMNPCLEKVLLYVEPIVGPIHSRMLPNMGSAVIKGGYICDDIEHAVLGTGLYMMEAKKHARLSDLIKAGTSIIRTRAHTTIATLSTPPAAGTPLGVARAKEVAVELLTIRNNVGVVPAQPLTATRFMHAQAV